MCECECVPVCESIARMHSRKEEKAAAHTHTHTHTHTLSLSLNTHLKGLLRVVGESREGKLQPRKRTPNSRTLCLHTVPSHTRAQSAVMGAVWFSQSTGKPAHTHIHSSSSSNNNNNSSPLPPPTNKQRTNSASLQPSKWLWAATHLWAGRVVNGVKVACVGVARYRWHIRRFRCSVCVCARARA